MNDTTSEGHRLAAMRCELGMTRADLAAALDVAFETVRSWEIGRRPIPPGIWPEIRTLQTHPLTD